MAFLLLKLVQLSFSFTNCPLMCLFGGNAIRLRLCGSGLATFNFCNLRVNVLYCCHDYLPAFFVRLPQKSSFLPGAPLAMVSSCLLISSIVKPLLPVRGQKSSFDLLVIWLTVLFR